MYETGRRAHLAQALCAQRLDWYARVPDSKEYFEDLPTLSDDAGEPAWFRVKSDHGFQHPSVVLVETVVSREDVRVENYHWKPTHAAFIGDRSVRREKDGGGATISQDVPREGKIGRASTYQGSSWKERKSRNVAPKGVEGAAMTEWRHSNAAMYVTGMQNIGQPLGRDGLGYVPGIASTLAVIRRMELDAEGFFSFLFSNRWKEGCLLRVLKGKLLTDLLNALNQLQKYHDIICFSAMAYIYNYRPLVSCNKMAAKTGETEVVEEKVLVELDCFYPQQRPEAVTQQLDMLDSSQPFRQGRSFYTQQGPEAVPQQLDMVYSSQPFWQDAETIMSGAAVNPPSIRCNMRGHLKPPPHVTCVWPYHIQREPFLQRRYREQSAFPLIVLPRLPVTPSPPPEKQQKNNDSLPEDTLSGSRLPDNSEVIALDVFLTPIPTPLSEDPSSDEAKHSASTHSVKTTRSLTIIKNAEKKKKKIKTKKQDTSDDDDDSQEAEFKSCIDPSREKSLKKDLDMMSSELIAKQQTFKTDRCALKTRLKRALRVKLMARQGKDKTYKEITMQEAASKQLVPEQAAVEPLPKQSTQRSKLQQTVPANLPSTFMTRWDKCPSFIEFYRYLQKQKLLEIAKKKAKKQRSPRLKKHKKDNLLPEEKSKIKSKENKENMDQEKNRSEVNEGQTGSKRKEKKKSKPQLEENEKTAKTVAKGKSPKAAAPKQKSQNLAVITDDSPYIYISDSEVPDDIIPGDLFTLMQVNRNFNPKKLKSSYSFERMFAHRSQDVPNYNKLLSTFSKPFAPKKSRRKSRPKISRIKSTSLKAPTPQQINRAEEFLQSAVEPSPLPMVLGKLKDFKFLEFKNFISNPVSISSAPGPQNEISFADLPQLLIFAMQKFVVRKEKATTDSPFHCKNKISLTFTKRAPCDFYLGVPPKTTSGYN